MIVNAANTPPGTAVVGRILTVNGGSSSIKFALFDSGNQRLLGGAIERLGLDDAFLRVAGKNTPLAAKDTTQAVAGLIDWLEHDGHLAGLAAIGHRVVHGGPARFDPQLVTPELLNDLKRAMPLDPDHLPAEIALIEAFNQRVPAVKQVACIDTAFHRHLPAVAKTLPIPRRYSEAGVHRYGFHGLSYAYLLEELARQSGSAAGRVILAHLGSGASMAAIRDGACLDTTMGLTPAGGLVMGTRTGDLDPGVLVYLARTEGLSADQLDDLVNRRSGLLGVSETSPDMRDLMAKEASDPRAALAVELFCYKARKWIGAYAAALGGLDTLVFAGGIGENSPEVRSRICTGLEFLGIRLDSAANAANEPVISQRGAGLSVRVIPTNEEIMIAQLVRTVVGGQP